MGATSPSGRVIALSGDETILDANEPRKDIPCTVAPQKPELGFDLKFHSGYQVSVPMKDLNGGEDTLTMIFRVTPEHDPDRPVYFSQRIDVPKLDDNIGGTAFLNGFFVLGAGNYHVDWMMRDRSERVCSFYWDSDAALSPRDHTVKLSIAENGVEAIDAEPFRAEQSIERTASPADLNVKVLVNFSPQQALASAMQPLDTGALVSILRNIAREPRIGKFSIVAFNMQEQRVVYRQSEADEIDFPALGQSLRNLKLGTVDAAKLGQKHPDTEFLTQLLTTEMGKDHPDAVIFAGPKVMTDQGVPIDSVRALTTDVNYPVFYMNYNLNPEQNPWRDAIGNVVKKLRGYEYTISRPRDLWSAWSDIMAHIVKSRMAEVASAPSATR